MDDLERIKMEIDFLKRDNQHNRLEFAEQVIKKIGVWPKYFDEQTDGYGIKYVGSHDPYGNDSRNMQHDSMCKVLKNMEVIGELSDFYDYIAYIEDDKICLPPIFQDGGNSVYLQRALDRTIKQINNYLEKEFGDDYSFRTFIGSGVGNYQLPYFLKLNFVI